MKKTTLFAVVFLAAFGSSSVAQNLVSTTPTMKNAIIEEFTGVNCPNCPAGHTVVANILAANPGTAFVVGYHPTNSSYTTPRNSTDPDFRRSYLDAFYSSSYIGSRFMPGALINRREWSGGNKITSRTDWSSHVQTIIGESSPANIGLKSVHKTAEDKLEVEVEIYFTADVTDQLSLYVHLMESGLVADQSNGGASYVHKHVFREALTAQWGDNITGATTTGTLYTTTVTLDLTNLTDPVDLDKSDIIAFIYNKGDEEVITGRSVKAKGGSTVGLEELKAVGYGVSIFPNPVNEEITWELSSAFSGDVKVTIVNLVGREVFSREYNADDNSIERLYLGDKEMSPGIYFLQIEGEGGRAVKKFIKR